MSWWDAVRNWFRGKRKGDFPEPNRENPDSVQHFTGREDWIRKRKNLATGLGSREISEELDAKIRAQSFFSARVERGHVLDKLREVSDAFTRGEIGQAEARTQLQQFLVSLGYDPQQGGLSNLASTGRLNLILEQNARMAYAVGRWQEGMDPDIKERFPCWRYVGTTSAAPRDSHARYVGHVYSKDDPIWHTIFPPSDFNCKCSVEDCDAPAETAPKEVLPAESGFSFDPAHAFEEFDLTSIKNEARREDVAEQLVNRFGMSISPDGKYASLPTDTVKIDRLSSDIGPKVEKAIKPLDEAKERGYVERVDFSGMPEEAAGNTGKAVNRIAQRINEYGLKINYIGSNFHSGTTDDLLPGTVFETREKNGRTAFVFNEKLLGDPDLLLMIKKNAAEGFHPKGLNSVSAYADHDFAHLLFYEAEISKDAKLMRQIRFLRNRPEFVREQISGYAAYFAEVSEDDVRFAQELLAECWASVRNTTFPPKIHKILANLLDSKLKKK